MHGRKALVATASLTLAAGVLTIAPNATAGQTASPAVTVYASTGFDPVGDGAVAVDGAGRAYAVFTMDGSGSDRIVLATRPAGGSWSVQELANGPVAQPDLAVNAAGDLVVVWQKFQFSSPLNRSEIWCLRRPAGTVGTIGGITADGHFATNPQVALDPQGRATVAWLDDEPVPDESDWAFDPSLRALTRPLVDPNPAEGVTGDTMCDPGLGSLVTGAGEGRIPSTTLPWIGVDGMGNVTLAWQEETAGGVAQGLGTAYQPAGTGTWSTAPLLTLTPPATAGIVDLAVSDAGPSTPGDATVAWLGASPSGTFAYAATRPGSGPDAGSWDSRTLDPSTTAKAVSLAPTPGGGTLAVIGTGVGSTLELLQTRERAPTSLAWGPAAELAPATGSNEQPDVVVDPAGAVTAVWLGNGLVSRHRPAGSAIWDAPVTVPDHGGRDYPQAAVTTDGVVTVVWPDFSSAEITSATLGPSAPPAPQASITKPSATYQRSASVAVAWTATDTSGTTTYDVGFRRISPAGVTTTGTWRTGTTATSGTYTALPGTVCFWARARSGEVLGPRSAERCTAVPVDDRALAASTGWGARTETGWIRSTYRTTTTKGAWLSYPVKGKAFAMAVGKGPGHGSIQVYLGTTLLGTWKLTATTTKKAVIVPVKTFTSARSGKLRIVVTTAGKPVRIDGIYVR